ncbi:cbb3-type cytochrome oxidase subunit 3 [Cupriavidus cauae]|uniref:CcoQ/FixQ family Cbb3-type cytochrome c oxidase assembly chaperone n=1 Tax=Cupriavidus cauae TaxID=2608999 RepID=A0A5M8B185_9BURK|nr:CcoQ/FixQ family Cbb3-type cytochrome c oxidase assembly chaperone [Cupriavidus cauae]KAA6129577.1 CcoQ/FixQ family Cbb3-type cytochrome c oxidase assembly chaperone [Cupriavidus cauae]
MATLTAFSTLIFLVVFIGIVCWAWSGGRRHANREAAWLPFALPDEACGGEPMGERKDVPRDAARPHAIEQGH